MEKSIKMNAVRRAAVLLSAAWILWNHTTNPASSQETWTPLSQFKTRSDCVEAARSTVKRHASTPRTIEGSRLVSPKQQPQKLLVYLGDDTVSVISYECNPATLTPPAIDRSHTSCKDSDCKKEPSEQSR
jgi:hypothetical protein